MQPAPALGTSSSSLLSLLEEESLLLSSSQGLGTGACAARAAVGISPTSPWVLVGMAIPGAGSVQAAPPATVATTAFNGCKHSGVVQQLSAREWYIPLRRLSS
jgi:hypothetical protein